jgi:hypothetical protein
LDVVFSSWVNLSWEIVGLLLTGIGITAFYINSKTKQNLDNSDNQLKTMLLAAQDILKQSDDNKEIKNIGNQVEKIKQNLESALESGNASLPRESFTDFLKGYELYIKAQSTSNLKERFQSLEALQSLLETFRNKYKDFILSDLDGYLMQLEAWTKISLNILMAKGLILNASFETDETKQLYNFYFGILQYLDIVENYLSFFTERGHNLARQVAQEIINHKPFENLASKKIKDIDEKANIAISLRNAAKAILWEIETYKKSNLEDYPSTEAILNNEPSIVNNQVDSETEQIPSSDSWKELDNFSTIESIMDYAKTAPKWSGEDFEECLDYINDIRS